MRVSRWLWRSALVAGVAVIFFAWRLPEFYGFALTGWLRFAPWAVTAAALYGIWGASARIIEATRAPPAPPPTTPDTW